jgi:hypothetical protein
MANIPLRHLAAGLGSFSIDDVTERRTFLGYRVLRFSDEYHSIMITGGHRMERHVQIEVENDEARPIDESIFARMQYELELYTDSRHVRIQVTERSNFAEVMRRADARLL